MRHSILLAAKLLVRHEHQFRKILHQIYKSVKLNFHYQPSFSRYVPALTVLLLAWFLVVCGAVAVS